MKFAKKSILAMILSVAFILPGFSASALETAENTWADALDANSFCVSLYSRMMQDFIEDFEAADRKAEPGFETLEKHEEMLPDEYAGAFIDDENILHVKLIGESNMRKYKSIFAAEDSRVVYEYANVSLKTLLAIQDLLDLVMVDFDIAYTATDEMINGLKIGLLDMSRKEEIINYLEENILDLPVENLFFEESSGFTYTATAPSGTNITTTVLGTAHMTIGFNAYKSNTGQYGVVTAGHGTVKDQTMYNSNGAPIGKTSLRQYSGSLDAAFVPFSSNFTPVASSDFSQIWSVPMVQGTTTYKRGIKSGYNTGSLVNANVSVLVSGNTFTNQFKINNYHQGGDSGAPVWTAIGNPSLKALYGIATFGVPTGAYEAFGSYAWRISDTFGLTLYN